MIPAHLIVWLTVLGSIPGASQSADSAAEAVRRAAEAMGGADRLRTLGTVRRTVTMLDSDPTQGARPARPGEVDPPVYLRSRRTQDVDYAGGRARTTVVAKIYGNQPYAIVRVDRPDSITGANLTLRTGFGFATGPGRPPLAQLSPESIVRRALLTPDSVRWDGTHREGGKVFDVVVQHDPGSPPQRIWLDRATGRLVAVETDGDDPVMGDVVTRVEYSDWRAAGPLTVPFRAVQRRNGVKFQDIRSTAITIGGPLPDRSFATPAGFPPDNTQPQGLTFSSVGKDLYLARANYNSLFLVADDHVVVLEAPVSSRRSTQVIQEIHRVAPGKPIRYVVSTHFHTDHIGGLRPFIAEGATIVTTDQVQAVVEGQMLPAARTRNPDTLSTIPRAPRFAIVRDRRTLGDAAHRIEVIDVSPSPHCDRMLVVWFPAERLLFEGDLLDLLVPEDQPSMPGDDTRSLARWIAARKLDVGRIIPVHGRPGTRADLDRTLARTER